MRAGDGHVGLAHDLCVLARQGSARLEGLGQGQPDLPHTGGGNLDRLDPVGAVRLADRRWCSIGDTPVYTIVVSCTVIFLFFSFAIPITLGLLAWGTSKWDKMGPFDLGEGTFKLFAVLSIVAMVLIFILGIQPPNDMALYVTVGFLMLTGIVWFVFERSRFHGPPIGDRGRNAARPKLPQPKKPWVKPGDNPQGACGRCGRRAPSQLILVE